VSRIQIAVLVFFATVWVALGAILIAAPDIYGLTASAVPPITFLGGISVLIAFSAIGVVRRWRWLFWLIVVAFLAGAIRIVASALELAGVAPLDGPRWYAALQGAIGIAQLAIGIAMVRSYRRAGIWGRVSGP
jgi:hypothetical protein